MGDQPVSALFTFNQPFIKILKNFLVSFLVGFLAAPMSYIAGAALGGLVFYYPLFLTWMVIGISWGLFLCLLTLTANTIGLAAEQTLADAYSKMI